MRRDCGGLGGRGGSEVEDEVDSGRGVILVRHGKGAKRPQRDAARRSFSGILRSRTGGTRQAEETFLFPGRDDDHSIDPTVLHAACRSAVKA